jgi:hypothetical protein
MRKSMLTFIICFNMVFCIAQKFTTKQTLIPLNNIKGVPFYKDNELNDLVIDGFEIDNKGNFISWVGIIWNAWQSFLPTNKYFGKRIRNVQTVISIFIKTPYIPSTGKITIL